MAIYSLFFSLEAWQICILGFDLLCTLLQLQQVVDSFIIFASQQNIDLPSSHASLGSALSLEMPWTMFSPSKIRMVPFPTREYTDDEFQSIVKSVMGLLYVHRSLFIYVWYLSICMIRMIVCLLSRYLLGFLFPISRLISYSVFEKVVSGSILCVFLRTELICVAAFPPKVVSITINLSFFSELAGAENKRRTLHDGLER